MRRARVLGLLAMLLAPAPSAAAPAREHVVYGAGGTFEVVTSPTFVTVLYLPEPVVKALASDQQSFSITVMGESVAIRPAKDAKNRTANLNIDTRSLHVGVILRVGSDEEAVSQVFFRRAEEKVELARRVNDEVERRLAPLRAEVETGRSRLEAMVAARARALVAAGLLERLAVRELDGIARTDGNVVVRVTRALTLADEIFLVFDVQNRDEEPYRLAAIAVKSGKGELPGNILVGPGLLAGDDGPAVVVAGGQRSRGVVLLPARAVAAGQPLELLFIDADGKRLHVDRLRID